jgi:hypothetical protein
MDAVTTMRVTIADDLASGFVIGLIPAPSAGNRLEDFFLIRVDHINNARRISRPMALSVPVESLLSVSVGSVGTSQAPTNTD